jgi:shikimate dehydrogenase
MRTSFLVGLIGADIGTSLSPALHEREADLLGLRYLYRLLDLDRLGRPAGEVLAAARLAGYDGINVTHPAKRAVLDRLDELSPAAAAVDAVNTIVLAAGRAVGHNTDITGFGRAVRTGLPDVPLRRVVLVGAGGAGTAMAYALLDMGAGHIEIFDRDPRRATATADRLAGHFGTGRAAVSPLTEPALAAAIRDADGLAHATPTGMHAHPGLPVPAATLRPDLWVADAVYRPLTTPLLAAARDRGCQVLDGGRMLAFQAAAGFALITGHRPDPDRMLGHFSSLTGGELPQPL